MLIRILWQRCCSLSTVDASLVDPPASAFRHAVSPGESACAGTATPRTQNDSTSNDNVRGTALLEDYGDASP
ncbi:MAG: hypothetical protein B6D46_16060 [Polyangiaceae bacterium UTPRO1]|nr:MAG: hypothetical protein B6D46_16060 [Polyangiaceae bacterium UTPRO1]